METNQNQTMVKLYTLESLAEKRGRKAGRHEGLYVGRRDMLRRLLTRKFGENVVNLPRVSDRLERSTAADLERWGERILDAKTLEEVFGE